MHVDGSRSRALADRIARLVFWSLTFVVVTALVWRARHMYFIADDWSLLGRRRDLLASDGSLAYLFDAYNGHLMAATIGVHHLLVEFFGIDSYLPFTVVTAVGNVVIAVVVRLAMLKVGVRPLVAAVVAPTILIWATTSFAAMWLLDQILVVATVLTVAHLLLVADDRPHIDRHDLAGALLSIIAVSVHSVAAIGFPFVVAAALRRGRVGRAAVAALPGALFAVWLLTFGRSDWAAGARLGTTWTAPAVVPDLTWTQHVDASWRLLVDLLSTPFRPLLPDGPAAVALVVVCIATITVLRGTGRVIALCTSAQAAMFVLLIAGGRARETVSGLDAEPKYVLIVMVLIGPVLTIGAQRSAERLIAWSPPSWRRITATAVAVGTVAVTMAQFVYEEPGVDLWPPAPSYTRTIRHGTSALVTTSRLRDAPGDLVLDDFSGFDVDHLRRLIDSGHASMAAPDDARARLGAQMELFVRNEPRRPDDRDVTFPTDDERVTDRGDGCVTVDITGGRPVHLHLAPDGASSITVRSDSEGLGLVAVDGRETSRRMYLAPGIGNLRIDLDPGVLLRLHTRAPTTLCDVALG